MKIRCPQSPPSKGFALISVLALVSLAALTTTAFLASAKLERMSSRTIGEQTRLSMALDSGFEFACYPISLAGDTWNVPNALVGEDANGIGYLFQGRPSTTKGSTRLRFYPLFSPATISNMSTNMLPVSSMVFTSTSQGNFVFLRTNPANNVFDSFTNFSASTVIPLLGARISPPVGWITNYNLVKGSNTPTFRFAYFTEDKEGLIDADSMGGVTNRSTGTNPAEISLESVGVPTDKYTDFTNLRTAYVSPGMVKELFSNNLGIAATNAQYFSTGNRAVNGPLAPAGDARGYYRIPEGLGYANSGSKALNINSHLTAASLPILAKHITDNLPNFTDRAGGFPSADYALTLAANIIDFADTDSLPTATTAPSGGADIRGYDSYPLPTIYYDQIVTTISGTSATLAVTPYVQFWNPSATSTGQLQMTLTNQIDEQLQGFTGLMPFPNQPYVDTKTITLAPNEVKVLGFTTKNYVFDFDPGNPPTDGIALAPGRKIVGQFSLSVDNGVVIAQTKMDRDNQRTFKTDKPDCAGALPSLRYYDTPAAPYCLGDPRMILYLTSKPTVASAYDKCNWWGMARVDLTTPIFTDPRNWPDGGYNSGTYVKTTTYEKTPLDVGSTSLTKSNEAPAKISNSGAFSNVCILGRIFDPVQWRWTEQGSAGNGLARISIPTNATSDSMYGGGNTLRIGKFEHAKFAFTNMDGNLVPDMQRSAPALLDIFCVQDQYNEGGKININTAPPAVLRALASGVVVGGNPTPSNLVTCFVRGVTNFRARHPFYSPSQLAFIGYDTAWPNNWPTNAIFGNTNGLVGTLQKITQADDEMMEEWFSKIYGLTKVGSFNYRIYVVAEMLTPAGVPKGPKMRRFYEVHNRRNNEDPPTCSLVVTRRAEY